MPETDEDRTSEFHGGLGGGGGGEGVLLPGSQKPMAKPLAQRLSKQG